MGGQSRSRPEPAAAPDLFRTLFPESASAPDARRTLVYDLLSSPEICRARLAAAHAMPIGYAGDEIDDMASAIRDALDRVPTDRWRCSRDLARRKIAEAIFMTFGQIWYASESLNVDLQLRDRSDKYRKAAKILRGERIAADLQHWALRLDTLAKSCGHLSFAHEKAEYLDGLTVTFVAILVHTTDMTKGYILKEIIDEILQLAFPRSPLIALQRGARDARKRYVRAMSRVKGSPLRKLAENQFLLLRRFLFIADGRFPASLFQPHRSKRTVAYLAPTDLP